MRAIEEIIKEIPLNKSNLEYIAASGQINGSLYISLYSAFNKVREEAVQDYLNKELEKLK